MAETGASYSAVMKAAEAGYLVGVLNAAGGNKALAAKIAGMSYARFCRKVGGIKLRVRVEQVEP